MTLSNLITAASCIPNLLQSPSAWLGHLPFAGWVIRETKPKIFVELGTHYGHSYFSFCQSVVETGTSTKCYAVDTWQGDEHAGQYDDDIFAGVNAHNGERYAEFSRLLRMTFDDAASYFADESLELLHIDGLHTYEAVKHDFETWLPKLAPGAVVMFHDTNVRERNFGVWKLWEELQARYPNNVEFVHSHGLGVLQLNNAPDNKTLEWLQSSSPEKQGLINYFAALGSCQLERFELNELKKHTANLNQAVVERDGQIASLNQAVSERDGQISNLNQALTERDGQIVSLNGDIEKYLKSNSWKATRPLRCFASLVKDMLSSLLLINDNIYKAVYILRNEGIRSLINKLSSRIYRQRQKNCYDQWVLKFDTIDRAERSRIKISIKKMVKRPTISILMPVYNPPIEIFELALDSVVNQIYDNWELCIADDCSTNPKVREILLKYSRKDGRIKTILREENGHISMASNSALSIATGDYVALMDHDDLLNETALFYVADHISQNPNLGIIYSDEDKIDFQGKRYDPYFKPNFDPQLLLAQNYICHLTVFRRDIVHQVGGFRVGYEGAQDYDLVLRVSELLTQNEIRHIPRILYHWRAIQGSTALNNSEKNYAVIAGRKAVEDYLKRNGVGGVVEPVVGAPFYNRIKFDLPKESPLISIIIPTRDNVKVLSKCIDTIVGLTAYKSYEIVILDNQSESNETLQYFEKISNETVKVIKADFPFNYSRLNNLGAAFANGEYFCFLNDDIEVINNEWLGELISHAQNPQVGCVGAKLYYPSGLIQHAGVVLGIGGVAGHVYKGMSKSYPGYFGRALLQQSKSAVTAACLMVKKSIYEEVGGFDEKLAVAFNDIDFCIKVKSMGYTNVWTPFAELIHHESLTRGKEDTPEKKLRFQKEVLLMKERWGYELANDEFYNPNLTLEFEDYSLAFPPRLFERPSF